MPDALPPCAHAVTTTETFPDGSVLVRCAACRYRRVIPPARRM